MSIILKGNNISSSNNKGIGPGEVKIIDTNIDVGSDGLNFMIMYSDPDDIIINNTTLSKWDRTILVVNTDHIPLSPKDGSILIDCKLKNCYSDAYSNMHLSKGMNYLRFFVYDKNKICNNSMNMAFTINTEYDSKLSNNTWEQISKASEEGIASSLWNIGDEIDIYLSQYIVSGYQQQYCETVRSQTITLQIWDFNHFDKSDGTGKAGIVFGGKVTMNENKFAKPKSGYTYAADYDSSNICNTLIKVYNNCISSELKQVIKDVKLLNYGNYNIFAPGFKEVFGPSNSNIICPTKDNKQYQFPIFTDDNSRIKSTNSNVLAKWWTRSHVESKDTYMYYVDTDGTVKSTSTGDSSSYPMSCCICFCFNI